MNYDLSQEKWIPVTETGGRVTFRSLTETLTNAHRYGRLTGDSPLVEGATLRLLSALAHRIADVSSLDDWLALREQGHFDADRIAGYLSAWRDRFDLFGDDRPFYQDVDISHVEPAPVSRLAFYADGRPLARGKWEKETPPVFTPDTAARHLLAYMTFDVGGFKSRAFPGENHSAKEAPLRSASMAVIQGKTLFETVLLNMGIYSPETGEPWAFDRSEDKPAWERNDENMAGPRDPSGYLDWLTSQSRRVILHPAYNPDSKIGGVQWVSVTKGENAADDYLYGHIDPMVPYRWVRRQKELVQVPLRLHTDRGAWRNGYGLICATGTRAIECRNVAFAIENGLLDSFRNLVDLRVLGMGTDRSKILFFSSHGVRLPSDYFSPDAAELRDALRCGVEVVEECGSLLRNVTREESPESLRDIRGNEGLALFWGGAEVEFEKFVSTLPASSNYDMSVRLLVKGVADVADKSVSAVTSGTDRLQKIGQASSKIRGILYSSSQKILAGGEDDTD